MRPVRSRARCRPGCAVRGAATAVAALVAAIGLAAALVPGAGAATPTAPVYDPLGRLIDTPLAPNGPRARLTNAQATAAFLHTPKVASWLSRYPKATLQTEATWDAKTDTWTVNAWSGRAGQIATGTLADETGAVTQAWTGPQVAWTMARGLDGAFGGDLANDPWLWLGLGLVFFVGLADLRRPLALRNLDLAVLLSPLGSLWLFNQGDVFGSMLAAFAPLLWLLGRLAWVGSGRRPLRLGRRRDRRGRPARPARPVRPPSRPAWPVWLLVAATVFALGVRVGLNAEDSNVIDVGYAGIVGADRIAHGQAPWGHFPVEESLPACGPADSAGETRDRVQTNGRCESANPRGDTYGPTAYLAYLPGYGVAGWNGKWDTGRGWSALPGVHITSVLWDILALLGLALVGLRFGGARLAATLALAWATYPLTLYAFMSNTNDSIAPALLVLGFWLVTSPWARGATVALAGWAKLSALVVAPLWAAYPEALRRDRLTGRAVARFAGGFVAASLAVFSVLLLEPDVLHAARVFAERTFSWQLGRHSPFSLWDWGQYHAAGIPGLRPLQRVLQGVLVVAALGVTVFPRGRRSPLQLAALTGALLVGFEVVLTHWSWLYVPWFFPFAAIALLVPGRRAHGSRATAAVAAPEPPAAPAPAPAEEAGPATA